jgi:hypothetical protein
VILRHDLDSGESEARKEAERGRTKADEIRSWQIGIYLPRPSRLNEAEGIRPKQDIGDFGGQ